MGTYRVSDGIEGRQKDMVGEDFCQECLCTSSGVGSTVGAVEAMRKKSFTYGWRLGPWKSDCPCMKYFQNRRQRLPYGWHTLVLSIGV